MTPSDLDEQWMLAFQAGDSQALASLYEMYKAPLYRFLYRYTQEAELSIDLVQDTFVRLQKYATSYQPGRVQFKTYLFQIAYRLMVNKLNRRKKWRELLPFIMGAPGNERSIDDRLTIRQAIHALPDTQRAVLILVYYHDMPQKEVSAVLEIPVGTVKSRLHAAIKSLKAELGVDFDGT